MSSDMTGSPRNDPFAALSGRQVEEFREGVMRHFREEGRDFPWRRTRDPWLVLTSEIMLQQTRTETVAARWESWVARYPDPASLASSPLSEILSRWKGLGYNRRALALRKSADVVLQLYGGSVPRAESDLRALPGVGPYTARAVRAFAFGEPDVVLETNIRAVFLFYFFPGRERVTDRELEPFVAATLDRRDPRTWYYALMDYGAALKKREPNPGRRSAAYSRQPPFEGSHRQLRAALLHILASRGPLSPGELERAVREELPVGPEKTSLGRALEDLEAEGFLESSGGAVSLRP